MKVYEALVDAFLAEGVRQVFALMGDSNMRWVAELAARPGTSVHHARHEGAALAMADGFARASGEVGICSVTSGPGVTQLATSLTVASRHGSPTIVFAGDVASTATHHLQSSDQRSLVEACGAVFVPLTDPSRLAAAVREVFDTARSRGVPVVLSVPVDVQEAEADTSSYRPSRDLAVRAQRPAPDPAITEEVADLLRSARRPVVLAGAGAVASGARDAVLELADRTGALLATSLRAKGWFEGQPWDLGISGGFATPEVKRLLRGADLVVAVGASLNHFTTGAGRLFSDATVVQIDRAPRGAVDGRPTADHHLEADARSAVDALLAALGDHDPGEGYRRAEVADALARPVHHPAVELEPGRLDPHEVVAELDAALPGEWVVVVGVGHFMSTTLCGLHGRGPDGFVTTYDFGTMAQGLPTAIGVALARPDTRVVLIEGDGGLLMNVQELETLARHDVDLLVIALNDGAYGAEAHKLRAVGMPGDEAEFGETDLASIARGFGLPASTLPAGPTLAEAVAQHAASRGPRLVDVRISQRVVSRFYREQFGAGGGDAGQSTKSSATPT